jgi:hypothetical protein
MTLVTDLLRNLILLNIRAPMDGGINFPISV